MRSQRIATVQINDGACRFVGFPTYFPLGMELRVC